MTTAQALRTLLEYSRAPPFDAKFPENSTHTIEYLDAIDTYVRSNAISEITVQFSEISRTIAPDFMDSSYNQYQRQKKYFKYRKENQKN
jgi:hypothetical protein